MNLNRFDDMIRKYSDELLKMNKNKALADPSPLPVNENILPEQITAEPDLAFLQKFEVGETEGEASTDTSEERPSPLPLTQEEEEKEEDITDSSFFSARVFTGNNAYAVANAKVLVIKDNKLFSFLVTDSNGRTKRIKLPAYPEENSLDSSSDKQYIDYKGEVYASGFTPKKDLLIRVVGGSEAILDVQLTPESERVE